MSTPNTPASAWPKEVDYNSLVHFLRHHVQPNSEYYVTRDDILELLAWVPITNTTVNLSLRFMQPDGQITPRFESFVIVANGATPKSNILQNAEGYLMSASVETPGATRGQAFVALRIRRGGGSSDITQGDYILQGYPAVTGGIGFPGSPLAGPTDGRGRTRVVTLGNPAAGADWSVVVPAGVEWIVHSVTAQLVTAVAAATRQVSIVFQDSVPNVFLRSAASQTQAASLTNVYSFFDSGLAQSGTPVIVGGLPGELRMQSGFTIKATTANIQAADQWSAIALLVEEFVGG